MAPVPVRAGLTIARKLAAGRAALLAALALLAICWPGPALAAGAESAPVRQSADPAPAAFQVALADLGFNADVVMRGARAGTRLGIPLPRAGIQGGTLLLSFDVSPVLHPDATVQVTVNGRPAGAFSISQVRASRVVEVPIAATSEPFLDVDMNGTLFSSAERCVQEDDASLWLVLSRTSRLVSEYPRSGASVADFLSVPGGVIAVQGRWDTPADREASIALFSSIQHGLRDRGSRVMLAEDATGADPGSQPPRTIVLAREDEPLLRLDGSTLYVSPRPEAREALIAASAHPLLIGQQVPSVERVAPASNPTWSAMFGPLTSYRRELSTLGLGPGERAGTGVLATPIRFTVADLGGWPSDLLLDLDARFDQVSTGTLERALLRVRLNGTLIETADLRGSSSFQRLIPLPASALQPANQLDLDIVYAPETGNCAGPAGVFAGQIQGGSGLTWSSYGAGRGVLPELIGSLDQVELALLDDSPALAHTAARLVGGLSRLTPRPVVPKLMTATALGQRRSGLTTLVLGGVGDALGPQGLPVSAGSTLEIVDARTNTVVLRGSPDRPFVAAQYRPGAAPILAIQASPGADPGLIDGAVRELVDPVRFFGWSGNVVLGVPGDLTSLDLTGSALRARQVSVWDWRVLLSRYRWIVAAAAVALVIVGCWMTYRRLGQPRAVPAPTGSAGA